ncbi:transporter, major facilitator family domain protein [Burkholderia pseudomallei MSHR332]|nr:transporter, major facilitator family domain protein [Burkholderia pseudomallei MSHR332]
MQADAGGRFSSADHGLGRARRRSSLVGRGCARLDLARLVGGVHRRARGSGIRRRNALKEPLGGMAGPVLSCCRAVVLSCCRAVVLSCCRAVVLSCCRAVVRLLDCAITRLLDCAIARLRDCVVGCARGRAVACSCVRVFVRRHGRVCAERSFDRAASGERRAVKGEGRRAKGEGRARAERPRRASREVGVRAAVRRGLSRIHRPCPRRDRVQIPAIPPEPHDADERHERQQREEQRERQPFSAIALRDHRADERRGTARD